MSNEISIRIIDNKKVEMTTDEFDTYLAICKSYDRTNFKGSDLFKNLFESDDRGRIVFLKPPSITHTSMEVFLFVAILMQHQHIRSMHNQVYTICEKLQSELTELKKIKEELSSKEIK